MVKTKIEWNGDFTEATMWTGEPVDNVGACVKFSAYELSELGVVVLEAERRGIEQRNFLRSKQARKKDGH